VAAFNGACEIRGAGINSNDGLVHFDLKAKDGAFDWNPFTAPPTQAREMLAIAIAAITANKSVVMQTTETTPWAAVWWFDIAK
jgi:hypothetical protein